MYRGLYHPLVLKQAGFNVREPVPGLNDFKFEKEAILPLLGTLGTLGRGALWLGGKALSGIGALSGAKSVTNLANKAMAPRNAAVAKATADAARTQRITDTLARTHGMLPEQAAEMYRRAQTTSGGNLSGSLRDARKFGLGSTTTAPAQATQNYLDATKPGPGLLERHSGTLSLGLMGAMAVPAFLPGGGEQPQQPYMPEKAGAALPFAKAKPHLWQIPAATTLAGGALGAMGDDPVGGALGGLAAGLGGMGAHATAKQYRPQITRFLEQGARTPAQLMAARDATKWAPAIAASMGGAASFGVGKAVGSRLGGARAEKQAGVGNVLGRIMSNPTFNKVMPHVENAMHSGHLGGLAGAGIGAVGGFLGGEEGGTWRGLRRGAAIGFGTGAAAPLGVTAGFAAARKLAPRVPQAALSPTAQALVIGGGLAGGALGGVAGDRWLGPGPRTAASEKRSEVAARPFSLKLPSLANLKTLGTSLTSRAK